MGKTFGSVRRELSRRILFWGLKLSLITRHMEGSAVVLEETNQTHQGCTKYALNLGELRGKPNNTVRRGLFATQNANQMVNHQVCT